MRRAAAIAVVLACMCAASAHAAWHQPVGGPSPINVAADRRGEAPSLTAVAGVPYVAWRESDGVNYEIRVARLNAAGTAWERVGETTPELQASPINQSPTRAGDDPSLAAIDGVPYVAWTEPDSLGDKIHVARLNAAGTAWEKVGQTNTPNPINQALNRDALNPSLIGINGIPYVAWQEEDTVNYEIRVARLNAAGTGWDKVGQAGNPASPINQANNRDARGPSLTAINGVPYVAWTETDGASDQVRVARLNSAGTAWEKVGQGANPVSPINEASGGVSQSASLITIGDVPYVAWDEDDGVPAAQIRVARLNAAGTAWERIGQTENPASPLNGGADVLGLSPSLTAINGVPYVAWRDDDGSGTEVHTARLNVAGTGWEQLSSGASPINESPTGISLRPSMAAIGDVPYVAWAEDALIRVSRLEPELIGQSAVAGETNATLSATWHTYGLSYPLGFEYGANLEQSTTPTPAAAGQDTVTVDQQVQGLSATSTYTFMPFATAGVAEPKVLGDLGSFTTTRDATAPETTITKEPKSKSTKSKAKYKFKSSEPNSTFACKFDKKKPKPCDAGKAKYRRLGDGKHKFKVIATDAAGNSDPSAAKDKFKVL